MLKLKNCIRKYKFVPVASGLMTAAYAFPAFAAGESSGGSITSMLAIFTEVAAWLWKEVGLFCTFVFAQPLLMLAMAIPFVSMIVGFFIRIFKKA